MKGFKITGKNIISTHKKQKLEKRSYLNAIVKIR